MLLIIDNYDSFTYNLFQQAAIFYKNVRVVRNDKLTLSEVKSLNPRGIILSPGPGRPEEAGICIDLVKKIVSLDDDFKIPLLGVCLGHQAIVVALGGEVVQARQIMHGKVDEIIHTNEGLYKSLPMKLQVGRYHSLIAKRETLPDTLQIDAVNKQNAIMGIHHKQKPIYGVQYHPESILTPKGNLIMQAFIKVCLT
ncbi:MAG: aminodeoxychorismate/anthranilate synthase component II [Legionellales bacterium RIFCSPHIGHO2_12_FULL_37_14]|nr:MAG: aminodeoxychorismate/anthranilate synthase component II [Legionellales bacterium RIFCSPHIGHO2_12_FULL_37_14]